MIDRKALSEFLRGDLTDWRGLDPETTLDDLEPTVRLDRRVGGRGRLGSDRRAADWVTVESAVYEGGARVWSFEGYVVLIEGVYPVDDAGEPLLAPDLGPAEATFDTSLGRVALDGGEQVHASAGLAVRVNPDNQILLSVNGFVPTTPQRFVEQIRPTEPPSVPAAGPEPRRGAE